MKTLYGFTLSEVLITLGIIGVVAAMTMPSLINETNNLQFVSKLKKVNSVLAQATSMAVEEYGMIEDWGITDGSDDGINVAFNIYSKSLNVIKDCGNDATGGDCVAKTKLLTLSGAAYSGSWSNASGFGADTHTFILKDETSLIFDVYSGSDASIQGVTRNKLKNYMLIIADVNGPKKPNKLGRDTFLFVLTQDGIIPAGADMSDDESDCKKGGIGRHCAAKVIRSDSMDY